MYAELEQIVCSKCGVTKEKQYFGKDSTAARGISSWCKLCKKEWRKIHRLENPEYWKRIDFKNDLKKRYNIKTDDYYNLYGQQKGCCACCGIAAEEFRRGLHVDHDHTTGQIRGLLCTQCNPGIGYFEDSIERLEMAIKYLKKFKKTE